MKDFFYGWYLKCQSEKQTLAVIPAVHQTRRKRTCSIQIITDEDVYITTFPDDVFQRNWKRISIGKNQFDESGIHLEMDTQGVTAKGNIYFGQLSPLRYDIMGPFAVVPFLECRHSVWSMQHSICGTMLINGREYSFQDAYGYWEGDRGRSFPKEYLWTQCCFQGGSLMLSVADIPIGHFHFKGIIGVVLWNGKEYRLATYLGARVVQVQNRTIRIIQGDLELEARLLETAERPLRAPTKGNMVRIIHESAACRAFYQFRKNNHILFAFETDWASFEYEYPL